jgi:hypothetical protein
MVNVIASFTSGGQPTTGLVPLITIRNVDTLVTVINAVTMSEVGGGWYRYSFSEYTGSVDYAMTIDGGSNALDSRYSFAGNENFVDDMWNATASVYNTTGTMGALQNEIATVSSSVSFIRDIENGTWEIQGSQMFFYASGSGVEIARFNLQDINGLSIDPTTQNPFRRVRF